MKPVNKVTALKCMTWSSGLPICRLNNQIIISIFVIDPARYFMNEERGHFLCIPIF
jgi:hypothetical protein